jgi:hypothetical protein
VNEFNKIVHLESRFPTGEPTVQPVLLWANGRPCYEEISKYASVGTEFFKTITPVPGHSFVYVLAVSAYERYGENRNGDGFPNEVYKPMATPPWIAEEDVLTRWLHTFEENGHNYRHHVNKDPAKAVGKIIKAFWNPSMYRAELLIDLEDAKAPDLAERIAAAEYPPVSMGTKVPYDVCNVCGNRAPTRAQYCHHLKYQMREIVAGVRVAALNPKPKFFDISWVIRPADVTAYMMKKVADNVPYELLTGASAGEYVNEMAERKLAAHKVAVIDKVVQGVPLDAKTENVDPTHLSNVCNMRGQALRLGANMPTMVDSMLKRLAGFPLSKVLSTSLAGGMLLNTPEVTKIIIYKSAPGVDKVPEKIVDNTVAMQGSVLDLLKDHPQLMDHMDGSGAFDISPKNVDTKIAELLLPQMEKRSGIYQYLKRQVVPDKYKSNQIPRTTMLSVTDPASGQQYRTTRGAAIRAHDEVAKRNLYRIVGGAALLGGGYKVMSSGLRSKGLDMLNPLLAGTLGAVGYQQYPSMGKHYMSDQGVPIPVATELAKTSALNPTSLALPLFGTLGAMALLGHDYSSRLGRGEPVGHPGLPLSQRIIDKVETFSNEHPLLTAGAGTLGLYGLSRGRLGAKNLGQTLGRGAQLGQDVAQRIVSPVLSGARGARTYAKDLASGFSKGMSQGGGVKLSSVLADLIPEPTDTVILPAIDFGKVAERIGEIIVEG